MMNQMHLVCYVESLDCEEVKIDKKGWFLMRNRKTNATSGIPLPSNGTHLKEATICAVCKALGVPNPPVTTKEAAELMLWIDADVQKRIEKRKGGC